ncbi:RHS repeat-associated core domain-containing protein [Neotabrizicola sp. sgz301269]|uniref:RHS repeat-associated core domain-containing protein n=1 Tax=Neotabrizicola sp. sgz301269 TaxID=3276282 RepID=UPI0037701618
MKIESAVYKPFGEQSEWLSPSQTAPETKGWIGERYDADAGLQYLNARYYDPVLGMFIQPDWFEVTMPGDGTNRYAYSFNDPVNGLDPNGNEMYAEDAKALPEDKKEVIEKDFDKARSTLKDRLKVLEEILAAGGRAKTKAQRAALEDVERALGNPVGGVSGADVKAAIKEMKKALKGIGERGSGVLVGYGGPSPEKGVLAYGKPGGRGKITVHDDYFSK